MANKEEENLMELPPEVKEMIEKFSPEESTNFLLTQEALMRLPVYAFHWMPLMMVAYLNSATENRTAPLSEHVERFRKIALALEATRPDSMRPIPTHKGVH
jgi:hypothetical protein